MTDVVVLLLITAGIAVLGIRIGMLVAPRLDRVANPPDETAPPDEAAAYEAELSPNDDH